MTLSPSQAGARHPTHDILTSLVPLTKVKNELMAKYPNFQKEPLVRKLTTNNR